MTPEEFLTWIRAAFRSGGLKRVLYCNPAQLQYWMYLLGEVELPFGFVVAITPMKCVKNGWAFLVDPTMMRKVDLREE